MKMPECELLRMEFSYVVTKMAVLNFIMKALTEALLSNTKQVQHTTQNQRKMDGEKTLALSTPGGMIGEVFHLALLVLLQNTMDCIKVMGVG